MASGEETLTDDELVAATRAGDSQAFAVLYQRYSRDALRAARALTRSHAAAEELRAEAFMRVLRAVRAGGGPTASFGAYVVTIIRNLHFDQNRRDSEASARLLAGVAEVESAAESAEAAAERELVVVAFATLPERWRTILWLTEVEERPLVEIARELDIAPNAVAALAYRARRGLRDSWLQQHVAAHGSPACIEVRSWLGAYVRAKIAPRRRHLVDAHLACCVECRAQADELAGVAARLRAALAATLATVAAVALVVAPADAQWAPPGEVLYHLPAAGADR